MRGVALVGAALLQGLRLAAGRGEHSPVSDGVADGDMLRDRADRPSISDGRSAPLLGIERINESQERRGGGGNAPCESIDLA